jgi:hypothetical protein
MSIACLFLLVLSFLISTCVGANSTVPYVHTVGKQP